MTRYVLSHLPDGALLRALSDLVARERAITSELLAHLAEVDARRLYLPAAYPSLFAWCVGELRLSEDAAFRRIRAARAARRFPALFDALADGRLHLTAITLLAPHLTPENAAELIEAATHRSRAEVERLLAGRFPQPDVPALLRPMVPRACDARLAPGPASFDGGELALATAAPHAPAQARMTNSEPAPARVAARARLAPLSGESYALQATIGAATHDKLRYAQALLGHAVPDGDLAQVLDRALDALIGQLERRRFAKAVRSGPARATTRAAAGGRYVPAAVRREVRERDGGRCTFVSEKGRRCEARSRLEYDHVQPFARGGRATPEGLRLRCRAHNRHAAEGAFGAGFMHRRLEAARLRRRQAATLAAARERDTRARERAARARDQAAAERARHDEIIPWLRALGFRPAECRDAADRLGEMPGAALEERVRAAIGNLTARRPWRAAPGRTSPA